MRYSRVIYVINYRRKITASGDVQLTVKILANIIIYTYKHF